MSKLFLIFFSIFLTTKGALAAPLQCKSVHLDLHWQRLFFQKPADMGIRTSTKLQKKLILRWSKLRNKEQVSEAQIYSLSKLFLSLLHSRGLSNYASKYLLSETHKRIQLTQEFELEVQTLLRSQGVSLSQRKIHLIQNKLIRNSHWISLLAWTANHSLMSTISFTTTGSLLPSLLYTPKFTHESYSQLSQNEIKLKSFEKLLDSYYDTILTLVIAYSVFSSFEEADSLASLLDQLTGNSSSEPNPNEVQSQALLDMSESAMEAADEALAEYLASQE